MMLSSCHHCSLNDDFHCCCHCHYMRRIYFFYGLTWFKLLITFLTWQEHILSYFVFPLLIKLYTIYYTLLSCVLPLFIKCYYLSSFFLTLNILISTSATSSSSLRYYYYCLCHYLLNNYAIFFFFFLLNFVYYIASISSYPASTAAYLTVINLWWFH